MGQWRVAGKVSGSAVQWVSGSVGQWVSGSAVQMSMEISREGCAGKGQAATLEQQRLTARGLGGSCREQAVQQLEVEAAARELEGFKGFKRLKPGKRQA